MSKAPGIVESGAALHFGFTEDLLEAGYILHSGRMLDFSGRRRGGRPLTREVDHREVSFAFPDDYVHTKTAFGFSDVLGDFERETGAIRFGAYSGVFRGIKDCTGVFFTLNTDVEPSPAQLRVLGKAIRRCGPDVNYDINYGQGGRCSSGQATRLSEVMREFKKCRRDE